MLKIIKTILGTRVQITHAGQLLPFISSVRFLHLICKQLNKVIVFCSMIRNV